MEVGKAHSSELPTWLSDELVQAASRDSSQEWEDTELEAVLEKGLQCSSKTPTGDRYTW